MRAVRRCSDVWLLAAQYGDAGHGNLSTCLPDGSYAALWKSLHSAAYAQVATMFIWSAGIGVSAYTSRGSWQSKSAH